MSSELQANGGEQNSAAIVAEFLGKTLKEAAITVSESGNLLVGFFVGTLTTFHLTGGITYRKSPLDEDGPYGV